MERKSSFEQGEKMKDSRRTQIGLEKYRGGEITFYTGEPFHFCKCKISHREISEP